MTQRFLQLALFAVLATPVTSVAAYAQRGPGGPGGPPGGGNHMPGMNNPGGNNGNQPDMRSGGISGPTGISTPRSGPQLGPPGRWWDDKRTSKSLSLRPEQQQHMDNIFNENKGQLLNLYSNLQREEQKLGSMSSADLSDETKVFASIDRVAQARADLEKENAHILLQIRKELTGTQLTKLDSELSAH